jgi:hypothetical protein
MTGRLPTTVQPAMKQGHRVMTDVLKGIMIAGGTVK